MRSKLHVYGYEMASGTTPTGYTPDAEIDWSDSANGLTDVFVFYDVTDTRDTTLTSAQETDETQLYHVYVGW